MQKELGETLEVKLSQKVHSQLSCRKETGSNCDQKIKMENYDNFIDLILTNLQALSKNYAIAKKCLLPQVLSKIKTLCYLFDFTEKIIKVDDH